jgi:transposase
MDKELPTSLERDRLLQLSKEQLVDVILEQALAIQVLKSTIVELEQEIQRLKVSRDLDSQTSSKPPSGDLLKKSEKKDSTQVSSSNRENGEGETPKRRPGGQPGHPGKTRKGFGRVDRFEILRPEICSCCNHGSFVAKAYKIETQQVAQLVSRPIEIVEYQRHTCICECCGNLQTADW